MPKTPAPAFPAPLLPSHASIPGGGAAPRMGPEGPIPALSRPSKLKRWSAGLTAILEGQEAELFGDWEFGPGSLTRTDFGRMLDKIRSCGSVVELRSKLDRQTGETGPPVVHAANYCGQHTVCPYCAGRIQDRRGMRFRDAIGAVARVYPYAYMVTATVPPNESWRDQLDQLVKGWQSLRRMGQRRRWRTKKGERRESRSGGEWAKVRAGLAKVEIKRGADSGLPHCHFHSLIFTDSPIDFRVWSAEEKRKPRAERIPLYKIPAPTDENPEAWTAASKLSFEWWRATGGAAKNIRVDCLRMREKDEKAGRTYAESIIDQSREVLKYATKFDSSPAAGSEKLFARDFVDIRCATYCRRLFMTYGDFREVPGSDFVGGGPHISERPAIWESRWRSAGYSDLIHRDKPVFPNSDMTPGSLARLTILNRAQGQIRRMRSAVIRSKNHFRETRELRPAMYARREYAPDGTWVEHTCTMEVPADVAECPDDFTRWETWLDRVSADGRQFFSAVRDDLHLKAIDSLDGTLEERAADAEVRRRAWRLSIEYDAWLNALFIRTLERTKHAHAPP